jgi:hypothetical protein
VQRDWQPPTVYNWSFGIQQNLGKGFLLDVAYNGNGQRHLLDSRDLNATNYGANFLPSSRDATTGNALNSNFLRPYLGYQSINYLEFAGSGNYHALQTQLTKRFSNSFTMHFSYAWSKALDVVDTAGGVVNPVLDYRSRSYGPAGFDRKHVMTVAYSYNLPAFSKYWDNKATRIGLDGWELSGVTTMQTGAPTSVTYSLNYSTDLTGATGNGIDSRVVVTGDVTAKGPNGQFFNTDAIKAPLPGYSVDGIGNAAKYLFYGPGLNNWDISLFKNFQLGSNEARRLQFRLETYNTFNHTQFTGVDTGAQFNKSNQQLNSNFGYYTTAALARRVVLALKLYF